jgi:transketolase
MYSDQYLTPEWRTPPQKAGRDGVAMGLDRLTSNEKVVVVTANLSESTRVSEFGRDYPHRFLDVGVAEQNMVGVATGLSFAGYIPFVTSFAVFSPGRSWDQVRVSVALSKANVKLVGGHGGISVGENGPSHQALEDIAIMRVLPNMTVLTPADANQTAEAIVAAANYTGPVYIRTTRPEYANYTKPFDYAQGKPFEIGKIYTYREVPRQAQDKVKMLTIVACGIQVWDALVVAEQLAKEGVECEVLNASSIKPFDTETLIASAKKTGKIVSIEDHQIVGGLGSVVSETLSEHCPTPLMRLGVEDSFGESAPWDELYKRYGLDRQSLYQRIKSYVVA